MALGAGLGVLGKVVHGKLSGGGPVPPEGGEAPAAGERVAEPVHRENIGKNLLPDEAARIMNEKTQSVAEGATEETRAWTEAQEQRAQERQADKAAMDEANNDIKEKGKRVSQLKEGPNATPEQIEDAKQQAKDARRTAKR